MGHKPVQTLPPEAARNMTRSQWMIASRAVRQRRARVCWTYQRPTPFARAGKPISTRPHSTASSPPISSSSSSVSPSEVSHFSRLASTWWDPHGPSRLLHLMNPLRHDFIQSCLLVSPSSSMSTSTSTTDHPPPEQSGLSYLDIGCGGGIFASSAARPPSTKSVTAIDPTPLVIEVAKSHQRSDPALSPPKLQYLNCAIEDLPLYTGHTDAHTATDAGSSGSLGSSEQEKEKQYDIITVFEVLEHIDSPSSFLDSALTHLKPGGWLVGSAISRSPTAWFTTKLIAEAPVIGVVPAGTHDWNKYINPSELQTYFETRASGRWADFRTQGVIYVPMLGWRYVSGSEELGNYFFGVRKVA